MHAALLLPLAALAAQVAASPFKRYEPPKFTMHWPREFCASKSFNITWNGGSGVYDLQATLEWPGQQETEPSYLVWNSTEHYFTFYPENYNVANPGSTFQFVIQDHENETEQQMGPVVPVKDSC